MEEEATEFAMSKATVEHDFLGPDWIKSHHRCSNSIRGIQSAISRINPNILRSMMENTAPPVWTGAGANRTVTAPAVPVLNPASSRSVTESQPGTMPLTIFYMGTVNVFHVGEEQAKALMRVAEGEAKDRIVRGDLPMARKKSLQRFLEKRKERLTAMSPYTYEIEEGSSAKKNGGSGVHGDS